MQWPGMAMITVIKNTDCDHLIKEAEETAQKYADIYHFDNKYFVCKDTKLYLSNEDAA